MLRTGDSAPGRFPRECPMCRVSGALCGYHAQMLTERASPIGNTMAVAVARALVTDPVERERLYFKNYRLSRRAARAASASEADDDL